jgi:hypothetical protein
MSAPANRADTLKGYKRAAMGSKNAIILEHALLIPLFENHCLATPIGDGLFRPSLGVW